VKTYKKSIIVDLISKVETIQLVLIKNESEIETVSFIPSDEKNSDFIEFKEWLLSNDSTIENLESI